MKLPARHRDAAHLPVLCIAHPNKDSYSETFIRAHIDLLPARVIELCDGWLPTYQVGKGSLLPPPLSLAMRKFTALPARWVPPLKAVATWRLAALLRANRVAAVLAEYGPTGAELLAACRQARVPLVVHFHGLDAYARPLLDEYAAGYRRLFERAAAVVVPSQAMERQLASLHTPRAPILVLPYGVDAARFSAASPGAAAPHFVAVGRFVEKKAPHLTLLAFQQVAAAHPEARLTMIGDGPLWNVCKQLARAMGLAERVVFAGPLPHAEVAATLRQARAFVQHSMRAENGDSEGTPVAILEAGASGLPVISTRHGGICDVVQEGVTGLLVDEGDVAGMAAAMLRLARDPALAAQLGQRAAARISSEFAQNQQIDRLWAVIAAAISKARS
jgi:colanic acid/amylovoran biosynthesis glycosyltransferase